MKHFNSLIYVIFLKNKKITLLFFTILFFFLSNPIKNYLAKVILEFYITKVTKFQTEIEKVDYQILEKTILISNLKILNTKEYKFIYALKVSEVKIENFIISKNRIKSFQIIGANLYFEEGNKISNLKKLFSNIQNFNKINNSNSNEQSDENKTKILKKMDSLVIDEIRIINSFLIINYKNFLDKSISIPLEKYIRSTTDIKTFKDLLNSYMNDLTEDLKKTKRIEDLELLFPEWKKYIDKLKREVYQFERL